MGSWKMRLVSKWAIFHFHDYGRKGIRICCSKSNESVNLYHWAPLEWTFSLSFAKWLLWLGVIVSTCSIYRGRVTRRPRTGCVIVPPTVFQKHPFKRGYTAQYIPTWYKVYMGLILKGPPSQGFAHHFPYDFCFLLEKSALSTIALMGSLGHRDKFTKGCTKPLKFNMDTTPLDCSFTKNVTVVQCHHFLRNPVYPHEKRIRISPHKLMLGSDDSLPLEKWSLFKGRIRSFSGV